MNKEATRKTKKLTSGVSPLTIDLIQDFKGISGQTQRNIIEEAIAEYVERHTAEYE